MAQPADSFDLGRLGLSSGEGRRVEVEVPVDGFEFGGQRYVVPDGRVDAVLDVSHTTRGYSLRLRFGAELDGPCVRCLESAGHEVAVDVREIDQPGGTEELSSEYLDNVELDLRGWARDTLALALPTRILCREECLGLCAVCGENLNNAGPDHAHDRAPDPRWAALKELNFE